MTTPLRHQADGPWFIVIAASAGGIPAIKTVLAGLPSTIPASIVIVQHRPPKPGSMLEQVLARSAHVSVTTAKPDERVEPGVAYLAQPDRHLTVGPGRRFAYTDGTRVRGVRSSANPLLESAAEAFGDRTIAVVLTGSGFDATDGVQTVKARGGIVIVQDPACAAFDSMPQSAVRTGVVDHVLPLEAIAPALVAITSGESVGRKDDMKGIEPAASNVVYWHRELPPRDAEPIGGHTIEATSGRVPGTLEHRDEMWDRCYRELMDRARLRLEQEVVRLGGDCAHVLSEEVGPRHDDRTGEAWMYGRFDYELYRRSAHDRAANLR